MKQVIVFSLLLCTFIFGCSKHPRKKKGNTPAGQSVASIHIEAAQKRADIYDAIAEAIEDGKLKTINDVIEFSNPLFQDAGQKYVVDVNALRESRLGGADDALPEDAATVFHKFADEYRQVGFVIKRK